MSYTSPFHTSQPETPEVYHDNTECADGRRIKPEHRVSGTDGRRRCEVCDELAAQGR